MSTSRSRQRLHIEPLEPRLLLSATDPFSGELALAAPTSAITQGDLVGVPGDPQTEILLLGGETLTLDIDPADLVEGMDLQGVAFEFDALSAGHTLAMGGKVTAGQYSSDLLALVRAAKG